MTIKTQKTYKGRTAKQWLDVADVGEMQAGNFEINKDGMVFSACPEGLAIHNEGGLLVVLEMSATQEHRLDQLIEYRDARQLDAYED